MKKSKGYQSYDELPLALTIPEVSDALRIGRNTVYEMVRCGTIPSIKIGRQLRVPKSALRTYLETAAS